MANIRDVAKKAGVHPSTVSRVYSGNTRISPATRKRVLAAASELGFHPNAIARSLSTRRTHTIGIVVPYVYEGFFHDSFFPQVMRGMLESAYRHDYRIIVGGSEGYQDEVNRIEQIMDSRQADGIVVMSSRLDVNTVKILQNHHTPFVLIGHPPAKDLQDITWVDADNRQATHQAIEHLLHLGHRRIAYIGGDPENLTTQERLTAYKETLENAGIQPPENWMQYGYFSEEGGYISAQHMANMADLAPTAFYTANDLMAIGALRAMRERGLNIPYQVSVIGTNDSQAAAHTNPPLTSLKVPYAAIAAKAVELLIEGILTEDFSPINYTLDCTLVQRASTAQAPS
jgi:DNA-binding LacI/PurR family transcriptional regulator